MYADLLIEIADAIKKLHALEESIIFEDRMEYAGLRSRQAVLMSEVIQVLHRIEQVLDAETQFSTFINKRKPRQHKKLAASPD